MADMDKKIAYVAMLDIVGFSKLTNEFQVKKVFALENIIRQSPTFQGTNSNSLCVKTTGDGAILCFFDDMEAPLKICMEIQKKIVEHNASNAEDNKIFIRMGINIGQVSVRRDLAGNVDIIGNAVNKAERLMSFGVTSHILASREFHDLVAILNDSYSQLFHYVGEFPDKHGIKHAVYNVYGQNVGNATVPVPKTAADEKKTEQPAVAPPKPVPPVEKKNPYQTKGKITALDSFIGRQEEVRRIFTLLPMQEAKSIAIMGERKIGNSSLLYYITHPDVRKHYLARSENYIFSFVECPERANFSLEEFFFSVYQNIDKPYNNTQGITPTYDGFRKLLSGFDRMGKCFVMVIDGIDNLARNESFDMYFFDLLRFVDQNYNIVQIVSTHSNLKTLLAAKEYPEKPYSGMFELISLGHFTTTEVKDVISRSVKFGGPSFEQHIQFIIDLAGYHPYLLQLACGMLFEALVNNPTVPLNAEGLQQKFMNDVRPLFQFYWDSMDIDERSIIADLVEGRRNARMNILSMKELARKGFIIDIEKSPKVFSNSFKEFVIKSAQQRFQSSMSTFKEDFLKR